MTDTVRGEMGRCKDIPVYVQYPNTAGKCDANNAENRLNKRRDCCYTGTMRTNINLPPATLGRLQAEAEKSGKDIDTVVTEAVEARIALSRVSLQDVLRPIHEAIAASGTTHEEAEAYFDQELSAMRAERKSSAKK